MKKVLIDIVIIILISVVFFVFKVTGVVPILAALFLGIVAHMLLGRFLDKKVEEILIELDSETENKESLEDRCSELDKYNYSFSEEIERFRKAVSSFLEQKKALLKITELTGENSEYVIQASDETEKYMCGLAMLLEIKLIALKALNADSKQYRDTLSKVENILQIAEENCEEFSNLLTEASYAADNDNTTDNTQLRNAVENLRALREKNQAIYKEVLFPTEDEFGSLFGTTTPEAGNKYGI